MIYRYAAGFAVTLLVSACSMSNLVQSYSVDYSTAMEQFSNEDILTNLLRARDGAPLHFSELSQVTGSIQAEAQLATTAYFGQNLRIGKSADQIVPTLSFTSSPTFDVSPLDTEAFSVGILQPIDSSYISMYWNSGNLPQELIFDLFISSIENSNNCRVAIYPSIWSIDELKNDPSKNENVVGKNEGDGNDSKQIEEEKSFIKEQHCVATGKITKPFPSTFQSYLKFLILKKVKIKTLTVMTPLGGPFSGSFKSNSVIKPTDLKDLADETSTHLGRVSGDTLQLYRRWDDQLALCVDTGQVVDPDSGKLQFPEGLVYPAIKGSPPEHKPRRSSAPTAASAPSRAPTRSTTSQEEETNLLGLEGANLESFQAAIDNSKVKNAPKKSPKAPAQTQKQGNPGTTSQLPTSAVTLIGMLSLPACRQQEFIVSSTDSESEVAENSGGALQIQVRSLQGVMEYIGRTLRLLKPDATGAITWHGSDGEVFFRLFDTHEHLVQAGLAARVTVKDSDGRTYFAGTPTDDKTDDTMQVLALLNSLINSNKVSSDIPTTKQVQVVP